ncbi:hypothetical protein [Flavobacterium sp.]|uniref:hypothetical protein n=1 Tax=Flavobacterium sp. TaxID=239 RepID=UPI0031E3B408
MKFTIITSANEKEKSVKNFDIVEKEINNCKEADDFVILNNDPALNDAVFLQGMFSDEDKYTLEIRFEHENDFSQYGIEHVTKTECLHIFKQYYEGNLPDLNQWENITKYLLQYYYNPEIGLNQETVHPSFNNYFKADFYFSIDDYFSPFGSDAGFDAMMESERFLQQEESNNCYLIQLIDETDVDKYSYDGNKENPNLHHMVYDNKAVVSIGFTNLKVNGFIMEDVKEKTLLSLHFLNSVQNHENYQTMISDLMKKEGETYGS